ncbi:MAG TPA: tRNA (adenosine(37)-N6)-threonylcarbamoyltransferase complex dimerization subunit type 1 TsaB [Acidisoma sp.]|nr:tRNA (adenosine(37)-N6)-threonylcarbamoyltransferase complex dimerization subunit type 1 TsaB [Acidisoma sp.]
MASTALLQFVTVSGLSDLPAASSLILAIDAASSLCSAVLWDGGSGAGRLAAQVERQGPTGEAALLPRMVADLLAGNGRSVGELGAVAVNVGPGSFTGLRASIAVAHGLAIGAGLPVIPVTMAEALSIAAAPAEDPVEVWCALDARNGRVFLHRGGAPEAWSVVEIVDPPLPAGPVLLTGDGAPALGAALESAGVTLRVSTARQSHAAAVAQAAMQRRAGLLARLAPVPLYIDPPRALLPRGGLRPPPQGWSAGP